LVIYKREAILARPQIPSSEKDAKEIFEMASLGMKHTDIAIIKGMSIQSLKRKYLKELRTGKKLGLNGLLKTAYYMANEMKNVTMMCFLLKTQGGLREKSAVNMTVEDKRAKDSSKREALPVDPIMAAKTYREIITK